MDIKKSMEEETRKLTYIVIFLSMLVLVIFGLGPLASLMAILNFNN
jgi:hypothetical protein